MLTREQVSEILLNIGAVMVNVHTPFKYASGLSSPIYTDCGLLASKPKERSAVLSTIAEQVDSLGVEPDVVIGAGISGTWLASDLSGHLRVPMAYLRPVSKSHGMQKRIEGADISIFQKAILVSDIVSTEQDILEALQVVESAGATPVCCLAIFTNNIKIIEAVLREKSIPLFTTTDLETTLSVALSRGHISSENVTLINQWLSNNTEWSLSINRETIQTWDESKDVVADILIRTGAVSFSVESPYKFSSGLLSPIYLDARRIMSFPNEWETTLSLFEKVIVDKIGIERTNVLGGIAMGGIPHATRLAVRLDIPMVFVKSSAEEYGKRTRIEGHIEAGDFVVVIDDIVTTGRSIASGVTVLRDAGGVVNKCLGIMTYEMKDAQDTFESSGLSLLTLTNLTSLVNVARKHGILSSSQATAIRTWQNNPWNWTQLQLAGDFSKLST